MAPPTHDPVTLLKALLSVIEHRIVPLTAQGVSSGSKIFGAAILRKSDLAAVAVATNDDRTSPLLHGEINCIQQFFASPSRPAAPADCVFLARHEPCSLCLSGIAWAGLDNFFHLFTYKDTRDPFAIPHDIRILEEVFRVRAGAADGEGGGEEDDDAALARRPLYNRRNKFFTAYSFAELVAAIGDPAERERWAGEVERVKGLHDGLNKKYQDVKERGVGSASVWK
ncbi:hypothetical protein DL766_005623 [Monosporascus sp. MC13-8B]|nr:hypothetical protein DL763_010136 [Monosporascus cannonballus]RYP28921.1 hypothetical protein DL766_005623 [Monosporascus sp. MC13-8B]